MSTYVLVHGGFMGGWVWREVANYLRGISHEVFTPTLTGFGERAHLANPEIGLDTHIQDIAGVLECEDLQKVILVGYSMGGMVITGVAEMVPERLSRLVYLDALIPKDGQSQLDIIPELTQQQIDAAKKEGDGWRVPAPGAPRWQPLLVKTLIQPLTIKNTAAARIPKALIRCTIRPQDHPFASAWTVMDHAMEEAKQKGWWYRELPADHGVVFTMPKELSDLLLELA